MAAGQLLTRMGSTGHIAPAHDRHSSLKVKSAYLDSALRIALTLRCHAPAPFMPCIHANMLRRPAHQAILGERWPCGATAGHARDEWQIWASSPSL
jgi:hypothetical protein